MTSQTTFSQMSRSLAPGKLRRLRRLSGDDGCFAMLAIDQRGSLRRMIEACTGRPGEEEDLRRVKRAVTEPVAPRATAVLTDPLFGYPATVDVIPPRVGVLLAVEQTGYEAVAPDGAGADERRSRLLEDHSVADGLRRGADAAKLLIYHHADASAATLRHQREIVQTVGAACEEAQLPFVLEVVTYALSGEKKSAAFARRKPDLVAEAVVAYADPACKVDVFKVEFPADLKYTEEYQSADYAAGTTVYDRAAVTEACRRIDEAASAPWVLLSAGVDIDEFVEDLRLANAAGASGFLCGRAVWKHVMEHFPDAKRMRAYMAAAGRERFERLCRENSAARPWHQHPRFEQAAPEHAPLP